MAKLFFVSGRFINNEVPCCTVRKEKHETVGRYHSAGLCQKVVYTLQGVLESSHGK